jgi:hypothetical protein
MNNYLYLTQTQPSTVAAKTESQPTPPSPPPAQVPLSSTGGGLLELAALALVLSGFFALLKK